MKKTLNATQSIIESILGSAVLTLIVLSIVMALSSCSTSRGIKVYKKEGNRYNREKPYRVNNRAHGRCVGGTCYTF
jgi:hypothetical protein